MLKKSLLRQSAQKYATGNIKKSDYLLYRKDLLDAIDNNQPLPKIPKDWLSYQGSGTNPELQTLMTQMHEMDETASDVEKPNKTKIVIVGVMAFVLLLVSVFFLFNDETEEPATPKAVTEMSNQVDNVFIVNSRKIIAKKQWINLEVELITGQWSNLTQIQKTALKRHPVVQQLKSKAIEKLQSTSDAAFKQSIQKLLDVIQ